MAACAVARDGRETGGVNEAAAGQGGMEAAPKKAFETLGISTLLPRLGRHIHSTLKVTAITAVMSFSIVRVS